MKIPFNKYALLGLFFFLFFACKKEKKATPLEILTSKTWKYSTTNKNASNYPDLPFNLVAECQKDDVFEFKKDGTFIIHNKENRCTVDETEIKKVAYSYHEQTKELILNGLKCTVVELTKSQIIYKAPISYGTGYVGVMMILE